MSKKDNVIQFPTKANVPNTITISFGESHPVVYTLKEDNNIDYSGLDTITVDLSGGYDWTGNNNWARSTMGDIGTDMNLTTVNITGDWHEDLTVLREEQLELNSDEDK